MVWMANDDTVLTSAKPLIICSNGEVYNYLGGNKYGGPLIDEDGNTVADYVDSFFHAMLVVVEKHGGRLI